MVWYTGSGGAAGRRLSDAPPLVDMSDKMELLEAASGQRETLKVNKYIG